MGVSVGSATPSFLVDERWTFESGQELKMRCDMNQKESAMYSRTILVWSYAFDCFDERDANVPVCVDQFSYMFALRAYSEPDQEQRDGATCVALYLHNNDLWQIKADATSRPIASKIAGKAPCWKLERWMKSFRWHIALMDAELAELRAQGVIK